MPCVRWLSPETLHVTLKFYGEIQLDMVESLKKHLAAIRRRGAFEMNIEGINGFPSLLAPNTIWTGIKTDLRRLLDTAGDVERASLKIGVNRERRPLRPHITLGRRSAGGPLDAASVAILENSPPRLEPWRVESITLMQSELFPQGPKYTTLEVFKI